ncbi:hypothetical protein O181_041309 [Austropuccinia psidii MF-1]|uniref:Velvet domain-containing protein n=1 Tax=Austropuccinia psidii MF-1 TaxID=1389203 RepID=A0A9Q3HGC9_9BASI|nr:hypothetical protein [Austropuccinia psidii MF-1]
MGSPLDTGEHSDPFRGGQIPVSPPPIIQLKERPDLEPFVLIPLQRLACEVTLMTPDFVELPNSMIVGPRYVEVLPMPALQDAAQFENFFVFGEVVIAEVGSYRFQFHLNVVFQTENGQKVMERIEGVHTITPPFEVVERQNLHLERNRDHLWSDLCTHLQRHGVILHIPPTEAELQGHVNAPLDLHEPPCQKPADYEETLL